MSEAHHITILKDMTRTIERLLKLPCEQMTDDLNDIADLLDQLENDALEEKKATDELEAKMAKLKKLGLITDED